MKTRLFFLFLVAVLATAPALVAPGSAGAGRPVVAPQAGEWHVCMEGPPTCDYAVIQDAVDAASAGDTIKVAAGTYTDVNSYGGLSQVVYISKSVAILGGYAPGDWTTPDPAFYTTVLDAQSAGRVVLITGTITATLAGLHIMNGDASGLGGGAWAYDGAGGGVYVVSATATISRCLIYGNLASMAGYGGGGGVYLWWSPSTLVENDIHDNYAGHSITFSEGGGLALAESAAMLERNTIRGNTANTDGGIGGGIYMECFLNPGHPTLRDNVVRDNAASNTTGQGLGGGIFAGYGSNPRMENNVLVGNFSGPAAGSDGAGLYAEGTTFTMTHTTISANSGDDSNGVCADFSSIHLVNTILDTQAYAITATAGSAVTVTGVLWSNIGAIFAGAGALSVTHAVTGGAVFGPDGYHIQVGSTAIDNGVPSGVMTDVDGEPRPNGLGPDLGADEYWCAAVSGATIAGPTSGYIDFPYGFIAAPVPPGATAPLTYTWTPTPTWGQGMSAVGYVWMSAGNYTITARVENCGGVATDTHTIAIASTPCYSMSGVLLYGPEEAFSGFPVYFAAAVQPFSATWPITYTWTPTPAWGQGTEMAMYTWGPTGTHTVSVSAENCGGMVSGSITITIRSEITGTVEPTVSQTLVYTDLQGVSTTVEIPAGAVTETTLLVFQPVYFPTYPVSPGLALANHNFDLSAYRGGLLPGFVFAEPLTVSVHYSDDDVRWLREDSLRLYYWDGTAWADAADSCMPPSIYFRDPLANALSVRICHLTEWGMLGIPWHMVYLPAVYR